jgi:hypothetical protein
MGLPVNDKASKLWKDTFDNDNYITGRKGLCCWTCNTYKETRL